MKPDNNRNWIKDAVIYQIYPQSFNDSNGDGIGDLQGIIEKLDYLADLGVTLLWLNPCFDSPFNDAGYDVRDFYKIAARYGTNDDMARLCREAHKRGLRVCLDLVAGHTSVECEWFKASASSEPSPYSNYYVWTDDWGHEGKSGQWISGYAPRNGKFLINFFWSQPALNYGFAEPDPECPWEEPVDAAGPQAVIAELKNVMKFWLDIGCDGFRVDMAQSLIKNDPDQQAVVRLWNEDILPWLRENYPHAAMIAEWGDPETAVGGAGFDIDFMMHFGIPGYGELFFKNPAVCGRETDGICYFDEAGNGSLDLFLEEYLCASEKIRGKGFISIPSANHDFQRLNYFRNEDELKVAFAFLLTWGSIPSIYYGDEIGMRFFPGISSVEGGYTRTGSRTPMQWSAAMNAGFSSALPDQLYLPVDPDPDRPNVAEQLRRTDSLHACVKELLALRRDHPALRTDGSLELLSAESQPYPLVYRRTLGEEQWIVALNPSGDPVGFDLAIPPSHLDLSMGTRAGISGLEEGSRIELSALGWGIWSVVL